VNLINVGKFNGRNLYSRLSLDYGLRLCGLLPPHRALSLR